MNDKSKNRMVVNFLVVVLLAVLGAILFPDTVGIKKEEPKVPRSEIIVDCTDGQCYDPKTGKIIGSDPQAPDLKPIIYLSMPIRL